MEGTKKNKKKRSTVKRCKRMLNSGFSNLPPELIGEEILSKVPITSLGAVRSTCKLWNAISRDWILGGAVARQQFLGFMTMDSKVCSVKFDLSKNKGVDLSIKNVDLLNQFEISKVFHCDGLLLCVTKDKLGLIVWNPYLGQTRWIESGKSFHFYRYALGYDTNRNHKILRFVDDYPGVGKHIFGFEIYDLSSDSDSWRVIEVKPEWDIESYHRGVSLKGNTYFFAQEKVGEDVEIVSDLVDFLLCFDFTRERFGPRLALPFHSYLQETVTLSRVGEEQLAVLYQRLYTNEMMEVWVTTKIEGKSLSWSKFLKVDMRPLTGFQFDVECGSFFIDEEKKVVVVFDVDGYDEPSKTGRYHTAFIIGDDGYFKAISLGEAPNIGIRGWYCPPLVCSSSYLPSLVQMPQRKVRDA